MDIHQLPATRNLTEPQGNKCNVAVYLSMQTNCNRSDIPCRLPFKLTANLLQASIYLSLITWYSNLTHNMTITSHYQCISLIQCAKRLLYSLGLFPLFIKTLFSTPNRHQSTYRGISDEIQMRPQPQLKHKQQPLIIIKKIYPYLKLTYLKSLSISCNKTRCDSFTTLQD